MRRGVGVSGVQQRKKATDSFAVAGRRLEETKLAHVRETLAAFKQALEEFAVKHKAKIEGDPEFRLQFCRMCDSIGVDPLTSTKGFWTDLLDIGEFYYELGMVVIRICVQTRPLNGGVISLAELVRRVQETGGGSGSTGGARRRDATAQDVRRAIAKVAVLGDGFKVVDLAGAAHVVSVPRELSRDQELLLGILTATPSQDDDAQAVTPTPTSVSAHTLVQAHGWSSERFESAVAFLLQEEIVWVDANNGDGALYMMPTAFVLPH